jgi:hypothetical protein
VIKGILAAADWFPELSEKLSARTAARFSQVDSTLDAITKLQLAAEIPLGE